MFTSREIEMLCDESGLQQFLTAFFTVIHRSPMLQTVVRYKSRNSYHFQNNTKLKESQLKEDLKKEVVQNLRTK